MDKRGASERDRMKQRAQEMAGAKRLGRQVSRHSVHLAPLPAEVRRSSQDGDFSNRDERRSYSKAEGQIVEKPKRHSLGNHPHNGVKLQPIAPMPQNPFEVSKPVPSAKATSPPKKKPQPRTRRGSLTRQQEYSASIENQGCKDFVRLSNLEHVLKRDIKALQEVYNQIDSDGNGFLSIKEIEREFQEPQRANDTDLDRERHERKVSMMNKMIETIGSRDNGLTFREMLKLNYPHATAKEITKMLQLVGLSKESAEDSEIKKKLFKHASETWIKCDEFRIGEMEKKNLREALRVLGVHDYDSFEEKYLLLQENAGSTVSKQQFIAWWIDCDFPGYRQQNDENDNDF